MSGLTASMVAAHDAATSGRNYGTGPGETNCVIALEDTLAGVYGVWVRDEHSALMVTDRFRPWSAVEAVIELGIGESVNAPQLGQWHVCQGWRTLVAGSVPENGPAINGHAWLWWEPERSGAGRILEANLRRPWSKSLTWGEQVGAYRAGVRLAVLRPVVRGQARPSGLLDPPARTFTAPRGSRSS